MSNNSHLKITMLGGFSITYQDISLNDKSKYSKKCLYLLEYLIAHRHTQVTQNDLIELLWPEETSENPIGALKTLLHRVRTLLKSLGLPKELVLQSNNTYSWNSVIPCEVDIEEFENLYKQIKTTKDTSQLTYLYEQVCTLYKGDFLPQAAYEPWVIPINAYYHSLYLKLIYEYINLLMKEHDYNRVSTLCCTALNIDNYDEELHYYFILSLYKSGKSASAIQQFDTTSKLLKNRYNTPLSDRFLSLNKKIRQPIPKEAHDISLVQSNLVNKRSRYSALLCDYSQFEEFYQLESYTCNQLGESLYLCLITLTNRIRNITTETIPKAMDALADCFFSTLRSRDIVSKYSSNQFVLLLPNIDHNDGQACLQQIRSEFSKTTFRSLIQLDYSITPLIQSSSR